MVQVMSASCVYVVATEVESVPRTMASVRVRDSYDVVRFSLVKTVTCGVTETVIVSKTCAEYERVLLQTAPKLHPAQLLTSEVVTAI